MNNNTTTFDLREDFIKYMRLNGHKYSKPCKTFTNDPTLFFTTAGMVPLKNIFLGIENFDEKFSKLANSQICVRAGGKHNDLDDVGFDTYHLTSFSMLGNWSLNSYWKEEAIKLAYDYLIACGLSRDRMYATYFEGTNDIQADTESRDIWTKYLDPTHVVAGSKKDNFWSLGSGPCGPCTEIHYDLSPNRQTNESQSHLVNTNDPTLIEIWNIVLMQYNEIIETNQTNSNVTTRYENLEKKFIDTGAGLERLAMVLQNKTSVYQIDIFRKIIKYIEILSNDLTYTDLYTTDLHTNANTNCKKDIAFRIFADHIRTLVVTLYDGAIFDCNGRGFILRKIIRRLLLNYYLYLNNCIVSPVFSHHIINALITEILNHHMFYTHNSEHIKMLLLEEELMFTGRLNKFKMLYEKKIKTKSKDEVINEFILNVDKIKESYGIEMDVIKSIDFVKIELKMIETEINKISKLKLKKLNNCII